MDTPRTLRELLGGRTDQLADDHHAALAEAGFPDLPDALVAEAVVSFAETADPAVAAHLAPFVTAHSAVRLAEPGAGSGGTDLESGLRLLASAPATGPDQPAVSADAPAIDAYAPRDSVGEVGVDALDGWESDPTFTADEPRFGVGAERDAGDAADAVGPEGSADGPDLAGSAWMPNDPIPESELPGATYPADDGDDGSAGAGEHGLSDEDITGF